MASLARRAGLVSALALLAGTTAPAGAAVPHRVVLGDTLWGIATANGLAPATLAAFNGLPPDVHVILGTTILVPVAAPASAATTPAAASTPAPKPAVSPTGAQPTAGRVTAADIAPVALRNGVPPSLAAAVAWVESGFDNSRVSSTAAVGVMQVMPGTWSFVQDNLARRWLNPALAIDNVAAGVLYLGEMLRETGGDQALAVAAYHQGIGSLRAVGMFAETRQYVATVMAVQQRFA